MAELYDISTWAEQRWWNTGGTRDKKIYMNPKDGELYYFKKSFKKGKRDYKYEFWSEIIAYEIGKHLKFNTLPYHIALRGNDVGCISKSMIKHDAEELNEGGKFLQAYDKTFNPDNIKERNKYTFQLIEDALTSLNKKSHLTNLVEVIVFDSLIGNSDRHQENWAIINKHNLVTKKLNQIDESKNSGVYDKYPKWLKKLIQFISDEKGRIRPEVKASLLFNVDTKFAPIYDCGCSFGRQLEDIKVNQLLINESEMDKFINNGKSEIHWHGIKLNHFELVKHLIKTENHRYNVLEALEKITENFNESIIKNLVFRIDNKLVQSGNANILPYNRKELVFKILTLRHKKLREIYSQYK